MSGLGAGTCIWKIHEKVKSNEISIQNLTVQIGQLTSNQKPEGFVDSSLTTDVYDQLATGNLIVIVLFCIVLAGGLGGAACGWKLYRRVKGTEISIQNLQAQLNLLSMSKEAAFDDSVFATNTYNYLAIGNSITNHGLMSYWWNEGVGMAASDAEHDYVHVLKRLLKKGLAEGSIQPDRQLSHNADVVCATVNFSDWELQSYDRGETLPVLNAYLSPRLDLVTIQLGENANDITTLETDYEDLINYVKEKAPKARIVVIGEFWKDKNKDKEKKAACEKADVPFADLSALWTDKSYQAGLGTIVYDAEGKEHTIEHDGVSKQPGDKGREQIAELTHEANNHGVTE